MHEFIFQLDRDVDNPFWDLQLCAEFVHKEKDVRQIVYGFYDGMDQEHKHVWKVRWTPPEAGDWTCEARWYPDITEESETFKIQVNGSELSEKGYLRAKPESAWGLAFDNGEPFFLLGDTMYNLFGAYYCGVDIQNIMEHRKKQGINYIRTRMQVSPYHPPKPQVNEWQTKPCWPWGGSAQIPDFTRLNLDYFRAVDEVIRLAESMKIGLEIIFEAWLWEFPFNSRQQFLPEYEDMWFKYIIDRYAASSSVYMWCPANEYEFYPGEIRYHKEAEAWLQRLAGLVRKRDPYGHPIGAHNWGEPELSLNERLKHVEDIDVYLVQTKWKEELKNGKRPASLCWGLESQMEFHAPNRDKVTICAEYGYERVDGMATLDIFEHFDEHHTRRGLWRAGFSGYLVVTGFNNTWAPYMRTDIDAKGAEYILPYHHFMTEEIVFHEMIPSPKLVISEGNEEQGSIALCLANSDRSVIAIYLPLIATCELQLKPEEIAQYQGFWYNPRTGEKSNVNQEDSDLFSPPFKQNTEIEGDWVLLLKKIFNIN